MSVSDGGSEIIKAQEKLVHSLIDFYLDTHALF